MLFLLKTEKEYPPVPCSKDITADTHVSPLLNFFIVSNLVEYSDDVVDNDPYKVCVWQIL